MNLPVTLTLQRLFALPPRRARAFLALRHPAPVGRLPRVLQADFSDTRPVIFRSEAFAEDLLPAAVPR